MNMYTILGSSLIAIGPFLIYYGQTRDTQQDKTDILKSLKDNADSVKKHIDQSKEEIKRAISIQIQKSRSQSIQLAEMLRLSVDDLSGQVKIGNEDLKILLREIDDLKSKTNNIQEYTEQTRKRILESLNHMTATVVGISEAGADEPALKLLDAIDLTKEYITNDNVVQTKNSNGSINIELSISSLRKDSRVKLLNSIIDNPAIKAFAEKLKQSNNIQKAHDDLTINLRACLDSATAGWRKIANDWAKEVGFEKIPDSFISGGNSGYTGYLNPDSLGCPKFEREPFAVVKLQFNLGNEDAWPLIEIAVYCDYKPDQWQQRYQVLGAYIPKKTNPPNRPQKVTQSNIETVDYRVPESVEKLHAEFMDAISKLDKVLMQGN